MDSEVLCIAFKEMDGELQELRNSDRYYTFLPSHSSGAGFCLLSILVTIFITQRGPFLLLESFSFASQMWKAWKGAICLY